MRKNSMVAVACFGIFVAQVFALTVELVNEYQTTPVPMLASATQAPVTSPRLPQDAMAAPEPKIQPAVYSAPSSAPPQFPQAQTMQRVDINYQQR
jgi:hypothetical protein